MAKKSILLAVAEPGALADISQALGARWKATSVSTEADAIAQLAKRSFDAVLVDFNLGEPDGSELLNQAMEKRPETLRFLLAHEADLALVAAKVLGSYRILPKPIEPASLSSTIESAIAPLDSIYNQSKNDAANGASAMPTIPSVYSEVLKALNAPGVTNEQVAEIIARDPAMTTELLGLTSAAWLGVPRNITDPVEAVASLGLGTVKGLAMALQFLAEHSNLRPGYLSLEQIWQHSTNVARIARDLVLFETKDRTLASEALTAGLLHDLGKVVLATNFDDLYGRVHSLARKQPVSLWAIEKEMFGATHGEIGGCLVGMWNMPSSIVETAAFHHEPPRGEHQQLTPLAAVHIANALEHELRPSDEGFTASRMDTAFLDELGLLQRLPVWRAAIANRSRANPEPNVEPAETSESGATLLVASPAPPSRSANRLSGPAPATRTGASGQPEFEAARPTREGRWVYACVAAGLLMLLTLWLGTRPGLKTPEPIYARTPAANEAALVVSSTLPPEPAPAADPEVTAPTADSEVYPAMAAWAEPSATDASSTTVPEPGISLPGPEPASAVAPPATATNVPSPSLAPKEMAGPDFRLSGIIYTLVRPSAIVNGKTVCVGDQVNGAKVIDIGRTEVTLQINGERKTCGLR